MPADTVVEPPQSALGGVARVLIHAGRISVQAAEDLARAAREQRGTFVSALMASGAMSASDLAHTLSSALALPLLDLSAVDVQKLPRSLLDAKIASQYQLVALG